MPLDEDFDIGEAVIQPADYWRDDSRTTQTMKVPYELEALAIPKIKATKEDILKDLTHEELEKLSCIIPRGQLYHECETHAVFIEWDRAIRL